MRGRKPSKSAPQLKLHKASGRAYVSLEAGRRVYFGKHGTPEAETNYRRFIAEWSAGVHALRVHPRPTVGELIDEYLDYCRTYYRDEEGRPLPEVRTVGYALRPLRDLYADLPAEKFGPRELKAVRGSVIEEGWSRGYINQQVGRIKRLFKWATENTLVPSSVWHAIMAVDGLRAGRGGARESRNVRPVSLDLVEPVKEYVSRQVAALIDLLLLTGARPTELLTMRPCEIDRSGDVWVYRPATHKNAHRGQERTIFLGQKAQKVLKEFLLRPAEAYMFSPREAEAERYAARLVHRRTNQKRNENRSGRKIRDHYTYKTFYRAVQRACDKAFPPPEHLDEEQQTEWRAEHRWYPYQLRHAVATNLAKAFGIEAARVALGHASVATTAIYAEKDEEQARIIAAKVG